MYGYWTDAFEIPHHFLAFNVNTHILAKVLNECPPLAARENVSHDKSDVHVASQTARI